MFADFSRDLLHGIRVLRKEPSFALIAVFTLALGISATATVFSLLDGLLLRPLPVDRPGELVALATSDHHTEYPHGLSYRDYVDLKSGREFSSMLLYSPVQGNFTSEGQAELTWGQIVTGNYFRLLGVEAEVGRTFFNEQDDAPGAQPLLVLSNGFWKRRFGGDSGIVGRPVLLNGESFTVVGVMPAEFRGLEVMFSPDFWVPLSMFSEVSRWPRSVFEDRDAHRFRAWARLASGVSFEQAQAGVDVRAEQLGREYPSTNQTVKFRLYPSWEARVEAGTGRVNLLAAELLAAVAMMVLLIACANVANLMLSRGAARRREMALRVSLGAARGRLVRQLLAEGLILALAAGAGALALAYGATKLLSQIRFSGVPLEFTFPIDFRVLALTGVVALGAALLFGLAPALRASRPDLVPALKGEEAGGILERRFTLRSALAVTQVALSMLLLVGAGLFLRTLHNVQTADLGLRSRNLLLASLNLRLQGYDEARARLFHRDLLQRLRAVPGVTSASLAWPVPLDFFADSTDVILPDREAPPEKEKVGIMSSLVGPDYFPVLGTRLVEGRGFTQEDNERSRRVAVVNETMARHYWPEESAIGKRFYVDRRDSEPVEIVGIAQAGKYRMYFEPPQGYLYLPLAQHESGGVTLVVHSSREAAGLLSDVRQVVTALDPNLPLFGVRTVEEYLRGRTFVGPRLLSSFLGAFGLVGLILAAVGVYGVIAYSVSRRTREIGIRIALGAEPGRVLLGVLRQGITLAGIGVAIGLAGAVALTRVVAVMLYGVSPTDPWTFGGIALLLTLVALWASLVPARRAMRVDPLVALRYE